jgi:hypothetical protein
MVTMRSFLPLGLLAASVSLLACGSSSDDSGSAGAGGAATTLTPPFDAAPFRSGAYISEGEACDRYAKALDDRAKATSCVVTHSGCPDFIRASVKQENYCAQWDEGVVNGCVDFISKLTCEEIPLRPCLLEFKPGSGTGKDVCDGAAGSGGAAGSSGAAGAAGSAAGAGGAAGAGAGGAAAGAAGAGDAGGAAGSGDAGSAGAGG